MKMIPRTRNSAPNEIERQVGAAPIPKSSHNRSVTSSKAAIAKKTIASQKKLRFVVMPEMLARPATQTGLLLHGVIEIAYAITQAPMSTMSPSVIQMVPAYVRNQEREPALLNSRAHSFAPDAAACRPALINRLR